MVRVIIEVDNEQELERVTTLLRGQLRDASRCSNSSPPGRPGSMRILNKYHGQLPDDYRFDREEAHRR